MPRRTTPPSCLCEHRQLRRTFRFQLCRAALAAALVTLAGCSTSAPTTPGASATSAIGTSGSAGSNRSASPAAGTPAAGTNADDPQRVLAHGTGIDLTFDNASAFVNALEFSLNKAGLPKTFTPEERAKAIASIAEHFSSAPAADQNALATARVGWK